MTVITSSLQDTTRPRDLRHFLLVRVSRRLLFRRGSGRTDRLLSFRAGSGRRAFRSFVSHFGFVRQISRSLASRHTHRPRRRAVVRPLSFSARRGSRVAPREPTHKHSLSNQIHRAPARSHPGRAATRLPLKIALRALRGRGCGRRRRGSRSCTRRGRRRACPVGGGAFVGDGALHEHAEHRDHREAAVLDLLDLEHREVLGRRGDVEEVEGPPGLMGSRPEKSEPENSPYDARSPRGRPPAAASTPAMSVTSMR